MSNRTKDSQFTDSVNELEKQIHQLEQDLAKLQKHPETNAINRLTFSASNWKAVGDFISHNILTEIVIVIIAIILFLSGHHNLCGYAILILILASYFYPLLTNQVHYPWEGKINFAHHPKTKQATKTTTQENTQASKSQSKASNQRYVIIALISLIVILAAAILFFLGKNNSSDNSSSSAKQSSVAHNRVSKTSSSQSSIVQETKLTPDKLTDKEKAAAVAYYVSKHSAKGKGTFELASKNHGLTLFSDVNAPYSEGDSPVGLMPKNTGSGALPFYTTSGDNVYYYIPAALPPEATGDSDDNSDQPLVTTTWQQICDEINADHATNQVKEVAQGTTNN